MPQQSLDVSPDMRQCIEECMNCHRSCREALMFCLNKGGQHAEANHIALLMNCAEICRATA